MIRTRPRKTEYIGFSTDPALRETLEREALRRDAPMAAVIRSMLRAQLDAMAKGGQQAAA